jgi:uncharacterized protein (DUF2267 family)
MSTTGLSVFDTTVQKTQTWLRELMAELASADRQAAYLALRGVLHALRDRLGVEEAAQLSAQLPMLIRGLYYDGWDPTGKPLKLGRQAFLERVEQAFIRPQPIDPERIVRAVFRVLARRVTEGEIADVRGRLPADLRDLWPS